MAITFLKREVALEAVKRARHGEGPTLQENRTYRMRGHFEGDPQRYRSKEEVEGFIEKDPILQFQKLLKTKKLLHGKKDAQIYAEIDNELKEAVRFAEESRMPKPTDALQDLYASAAGQGFAKGGSL